MIDAAFKALAQIFAPPLRRVLLKAVGLALILIVFIGVLLYRLLAAWAETGANWAEQTAGMAPHAVWSALAWLLSIMAGLGIITGALFLMPAVSAFVGSFFVDEVGEAVEREHYPGEPVGRALPFLLALVEGLKVALLALLVYLFSLPFFLVAGLGVIMLFLANSYLLGREYFELAAMRFRPPEEAKAMRKANAVYLFIAGMIIAGFVSIPILNFATPVFAMAFMVHMHKKLSGSPAALMARPR
ncbi:MAG TPA: sulfate transporter family protein [Pseudolabrys sp.]|nr:sulfate transporter family protein [Pseudolabrys sp.]